MVAECLTWTRDLHRILCMQGGDGDESYLKNSYGPAIGVDMSKPHLIEAIRTMKLYEGEQTLKIADLGCAMGQNTLSTMEIIVTSLRRKYEEEGYPVPEFEVYFSDLPSNDFNSLFKLMDSKCNQTERGYYAAAVPGSFYERLFPKGKLHVAVSLSTLHWLSQIPDAVMDKSSPAFNRGRAWIDGARKEVVEAYAKQAAEDLIAFLKARKEEIVPGGVMYIMMAGRPQSEPENQIADPDSKAKNPFTNTMDHAWQALLNERLIDEETLDTFNIPTYNRSMEEVKKAFDSCDGFEMKHIEFRRILEHSAEKQEMWMKDPVSYGRAKVHLIQASLTTVIEAHLGPELSEELFKRYEKLGAEDITMLHKTLFYGVILVSAVRK